MIFRPTGGCKDLRTGPGWSLLFLETPKDCDKNKIFGATLRSVGSALDPCAEALQRTRARVPARVSLLRVTPSLTLFPVTLFSCTVNKARKGQKNIKKKQKKTTRFSKHN